jgi:hypothetical protein
MFLAALLFIAYGSGLAEMVRGKCSEVTALLDLVDPAVAVGDSPCGLQSAIGQRLLLTLRRARLPPCWLSPACAGRPVRGETQHFSSGPCFLSPMQLHMDRCGEPSLLFAGRACASVGELLAAAAAPATADDKLQF